MRFPAGLLPLLACLVANPAGEVSAQHDSSRAHRSTRHGVFTAAQAERGGEIYAMSCANCHPPVTHTGPAFTAAWQGRPLSELYEYMREAMPKTDPGSLSAGEYARVLAYLLQLNGMPAGSRELEPDPVVLSRIRIEWTNDSPQPHR